MRIGGIDITKYRNRLGGIIVLSLVLGLFACAANDQGLIKAHNSLMAADATYEAAWQAFLDAQSQGLVSDSDFQKGFKAAKAYEFAWSEAVRAYATYIESGGDDARSKAILAMTEASRFLGELIGFVNSFIDVEVR